MKLTIDTTQKTLVSETESTAQTIPLYSDRAFELLSELWIKVGWNQRYSYDFSWMGRPIIQLPEDIIRIQEVLWRVKPDVIIETGVAHGGSLILYASLCKAMGKGRVIGVDIEIRPDNRTAIEQHNLAPLITLIEGSSIAQETIVKVKSLVHPSERILVILDSCHSHNHVRSELEAYACLVTPDSYIVATDGIMKDLVDVPRGLPEWAQDNPTVAAAEFAASHPEFVVEQPPRVFHESNFTCNLTYWPGAYLRRLH